MIERGVRAIIPAAGLSSRMTGFKPLLDLGGKTAMERLIGLFRSVGVGRVHVVCGHRADELEPVVRAAGAEPVPNPDYRRGMFSSVCAGVRALDSETRAFFMLPVDVMLVRYDTLLRLSAARERDPDLILHPVFAGRRGHPPLIPAGLRDDILQWDGARGLAGFLAEREHLAREVPVADEFVHFDVDGDEDYREAISHLKHYDLPSRAECLALLSVEPNVNDMGRRHSIVTADIALQLSSALNAVRNEGERLDLGLVEAAGLLHDIAKGLPDHEREGGRRLAEMGYERVGEVVAAHRDIDLHADEPVTEREIVYFSDKLARGDSLVTVRERFEAKMEEHSGDPGAVAAIRGRLGRALRVEDRIEAELGKAVEDVVGQPDARP
jgi:CTP:molybdopterin cytidylyltransferase MocA